MKELKSVRFILRNIKERPRSSLIKQKRPTFMELSDETMIVKKPWSSLKEMAMQKDVEEQEWFKNLTQKD